MQLLRPLGVTGFRLLFLSTLASSLGTLLAAVALAVDVKDRTDSGLWVGALMVVEFLPTILIGLLLGPLLDRVSRRGLMVAADLVRAAVFCALPFAPGAGAIVALAAVAGIASGFFRPAAYAGVPNLVPEDELPEANALLQGSENASWAVGPLIGGVLTAASGPHAAYWVNAGSFLVSAALVARIPQRLLQSTVALSRGYWRDLGEGFLVVRRSPPLRTVLVVWTVAMTALGLVNVAEVFLAKDSFHAGDFGFGLLYGAIGAGLVLGSLAAGPLVGRFGVRGLYAGAIALMAAAFGGAAAAPDVWVAAALCVVGGIGNGAANVSNVVLVQRGAPDRVRGRALTLVMSVNYVVLGASMGAAGPLVDGLGARWTWFIAACLLAGTSVLAFALTRRIALPEPASVGQPAELELAARAAAE